MAYVFLLVCPSWKSSNDSVGRRKPQKLTLSFGHGVLLELDRTRIAGCTQIAWGQVQDSDMWGYMTIVVGSKKVNLGQMRTLAREFIKPSRPKDPEHDFSNVFQKSRQDISELLGPRIDGARLMVLGCGYNYPDVALWSTVVDDVVGVDVRRAFWRNGLGRLYKSLRHDGRGRFRSIGESIYRRRGYPKYFRRLRGLSGADLDFAHQDLISYDGKSLPFADESFDVICSNAVLEHVSDLPTLAREMRRVTKEGGIGYHLWHNYYSLSGGHVSDRLVLERPWGHLLGDPDVALHLGLSGTYLNKMLPSCIVKDLASNFHSVSVFQVDKDHRKKGIDHSFSYEGERLLTPDLEQRLSPISREVLLTRAYLIVGKISR
jgi:SAM-dependent methyltransferase